MTSRTAKVGHKKTRTGCLTCRSRKVKCDEASPKCNNCSRLDLVCEYKSQPNRSRRSQAARPRTTRASIDSRGDFQPDKSPSDASGFASHHSDTGSGHERMALRLLHAWMSRGLLKDSIASVPEPEWRRIWLVEVPELAMKHDYLLHSLLALSATQLSAANPTDHELSMARLNYWSLALSEQQRVISNHDNTEIEPIAFASIMIANNAFGMLRDRDLEPYVPPWDWLEVSKGAWKVWPFPENIPPGSSLLTISGITLPIWSDKNEKIHPAYHPVLHQLSAEDTVEDISVYRETLALISSLRAAILGNEPSNFHVRRICLWAQTIPYGFVQLLREQRGRALVVISYFFAVVAHSEALPFFGDVEGIIPRREVQAIAKVLPQEWQGHMAPVFDQLSVGPYSRQF